MREQRPGWFDKALDRTSRLLAPLIEPYVHDEAAPKGTLDRLDRVIDALLYVLSGALMIAISAVVTYSIFMRYALTRPPLWSEAVPLVFFIWMTFLALAVATRRGDNIRVTYFIEKLSPRARMVLEMVMHALVVTIMLLIFWYSFTVIQLQMRATMLSTGWNQAWSWFPLPIGMALMTLYQFKRVRWTWRTYRAATAPAGERE